MELTYNEISHFLNQHTILMPFPGLHPDYVIADSIRDPSLTPHFFLYSDNNEHFYHPFITSHIQDTDYQEIISAYGYGGPISTSTDLQFLANAAEEFKLWCQQKNVLVETIRFHPLLQNWRYYHGDSIPKRHTAYINLQVDDLLNSYSTSARYSVRKAIKSNVTIQIVDTATFLSVFPAMYFKRMKEVGAREFYFFNQEYFKHLCKMNDTLKLFALYKDEVIAVSIFIMQGKIIDYHLACSNMEFKQIRSNSLLMHEAFLFAKQHGFQFGHMGGGLTDKLDDPLLVFKLGFGGKLSEFRIGKYIHNAELYKKLVAEKILMER